VAGTRKAKWVRRVEKATFNRLFVFLVRRGWAPPYAIVETIGRSSGLPRQIPVANALRGDTFWVVAEQGRHADWVRNIEREPRVRVCVSGRWRAGTAVILDGDDYLARYGTEVPRWNKPFVQVLGVDPVTVRIDLDPASSA
jgi:deazaflavin-dependent oxidoreductase (nitroreductase family)